MKIGEMLNTLFGIDVNTEYVAEQVQNLPNPHVEVDNIEGSTVEQQNTEEHIDDSAVTIQRQQAEIEALRKANAALLNKTPITSEELSVEDMIFRAVVGVEK